MTISDVAFRWLDIVALLEGSQPGIGFCSCWTKPLRGEGQRLGVAASSNYRIDALLGHGGFGITYRATDQDLKQVVAIKEYLPREIATRDRDSTVVPVSGSDQETFLVAPLLDALEALHKVGVTHRDIKTGEHLPA